MTTADPQRLELLVIQPTPFCNLDCEYLLSARQELDDENLGGGAAPGVRANLVQQLRA